MKSVADYTKKSVVFDDEFRVPYFPLVVDIINRIWWGISCNASEILEALQEVNLDEESLFVLSYKFGQKTADGYFWYATLFLREKKSNNQVAVVLFPALQLPGLFEGEKRSITICFKDALDVKLRIWARSHLDKYLNLLAIKLVEKLLKRI